MIYDLPPLPEKEQIDKHLPTGIVIRGYTSAQMQAYARAAIAAARQPQPVQVVEHCLWARNGNSRCPVPLAQPQPVQQPVAWSERIKELADQYAIECVEFSKGIPNGAHSMSPIAVKAGDTRLALHSAIDTAERFIRAIESATLAAQVERATQPQPVQQEPVAWYEHNPDLDAWFLAYTKNPSKHIKSRPLVFVDLASPQAQQPLSDERLCEAMRKAAEELLDHIYEFGTISEGVNPRLLAVGRSIEKAHGITKGTT